MRDLVTGISSGRNKERNEEGRYYVYGSTGIIGKTSHCVYYEPHILVARVGAYAGYVQIALGEYDVSDNALVISLKPNADLKYVFYVLQNMKLNQYAKGGGQPLITATQLKNLYIPLPPLEVQEKIVETLDKFDKLCNDLSEGLPAEIEARQKQYEYYRDKLLSF